MRTLACALFIYSIIGLRGPASAQPPPPPPPSAPPPGSQCPGALAFPPLSLSEGLNSTCPSAQLTGPVLLPSPVVAGFLVLVENVAHDPKDPTNWSDALVFNNLQHAPLVGECDAYATFVSSCPGSGGTVVGVTDADLASVGVTTRDILNGNTLYLLESTTSTLNTYGAGLNVYYLYSDLPTPTPTQRKTWGRLKAWYR